MSEWVSGPLKDTIDVINYTMASEALKSGKSAEETIKAHERKVTEQRPWASHFRRDVVGTEPVTKTFLAGSDIEGDYPILIGIKPLDNTTTPSALATHETRIEGGVNLNDFTFLEVPRDKIAETKSILEQYNLGDLPVFALETGEDYAFAHPEASDSEYQNLVSKAKQWKSTQNLH